MAKDPREPVVTEHIPAPDMSIEGNVQAFAQFTRIRFAEMSHKYCGRGLNFSSGKFTDVEQQRFQTCLTKY